MYLPPFPGNAFRDPDSFAELIEHYENGGRREADAELAAATRAGTPASTTE